MTPQARLRGRSVQALRPSKDGTGPKRWHTLIRIPEGASRRDLTPVPGKCQEGVEYVWKAEGRTFRVRIHDPDPSVVPTATNPSPNALVGWVVRIKRGRHYMDPEGRFHPAGKLNPRSTEFDEFLGNETHIPILPPASYPGGGPDEHSD
jgi:hypothetical protein